MLFLLLKNNKTRRVIALILINKCINNNVFTETKETVSRNYSF